jgi:hypothetical protein
MEETLTNIMPAVEYESQVGGATFQIPGKFVLIVKTALGIKWLLIFRVSVMKSQSLKISR